MFTTTSRLVATFATLILVAAAPLTACSRDSGATTTTPESVTDESPVINAEPATTDAAVVVGAFDFVQPVTLDTLISGELVVVTIDDVHYLVRLIGVDVPDSHVDEARDLMERTIAESGSQDMWLEFDDPLGRLDEESRDDQVKVEEPRGPDLQAYVWTSHPETGELDEMLNLVQIEVGLATVVYTDTSTYRHQTQFRRAEGYARGRGFGLWTEEGGVGSTTPSLPSPSRTDPVNA